MSRTKLSLALFAAGLMIATSALAEEVTREGVIISGSGHTLQVRTREGPLTVHMQPGAKIEEVSGLSRKQRDMKSLIPGLIIKVEGEESGGSFSAHEVNFKKNDWRAAIASKAGTQEEFAATNRNVAELKKAIIEGNEYVIQDEATVYFPTGSAVVGEQYKAKLHQLAQKAPSFGNYRISILGFADPRGNAAANERLSLKRSMAVSNYLRQTGMIQPGRVLSPSAMGEGSKAPEEAAAPSNHDEARRVLVRVVTPKTQLK